MASKRTLSSVFSTRKQAFFLAMGLSFLILISFFLDEYVLVHTSLFHASWLIAFMGLISSLGSTMLIIIVMTLLLIRHPDKREYLPVLWATILTTFIIVHLLKFGIARSRPFDIIITTFGFISHSFPSAHAAVAFSLLPLMDRIYPTQKWIWTLFAVLVALSRIYIQVHYLSDIIAGAIIGYAIGSVVMHLEEQTGFVKKWHFLIWK
ncbi:MAG: phosphatase PAP2 family protein [Nanoarchaeota archaeon]